MPESVSLRRQLFVWLLVPLLAVFFVGSAISYFIALRFANIAYDYGLYDEARSISQQVRTEDGHISLRLPREAVEILESDPYDKVYFKVTDRDSAFVSGSRELPTNGQAIAPGRVVYYDATMGPERVRVAGYAPASASGEVSFLVFAAETLVKRERLAGRIFLAVLAPQFLLIVLAGGLVWFGVRRALIPLQRLTAAISHRSHRDLRPITGQNTPLEVVPLINAINDLLERLKHALAAQARFIADAAHQLRTPLAGLSAQTDRALRANDAESIQSALKQLAMSSKRAVRLANQLLTLARTEPGKDAIHFKRVDLAALTHETCMEWVPHALAHGVDLGFNGCESEVYIQGDALLLSEMLNNLIDNAIRYGDCGCVVTVRLEDSPQVTLSVEDNGLGIPTAERGRVFERFYRIPGSPIGGCGLGLSIVAEIAHQHGATVSIDEPQQGRGTIVKVVFLGEDVTSVDTGSSGKASVKAAVN